MPRWSRWWIKRETLVNENEGLIYRDSTENEK